MEYTIIYCLCLNRLEGIHKQYSRLLKLLKCRYELYEDKLADLNHLEDYCDEKLKLSERSDMLERLRIAKENCKIKMNRYKQEEM